MAWTKYVSTDTADQKDSLNQANQGLKDILIELIDTNRAVLYELRLLNARFEEAFETQICCEDIEE